MKTILLLLSLLFTSQAHALKTVVISLGESKKIALAGASSVWIENRQVVTAQALGNQLVLKGMKVGESLLRLHGENLKIQVLHPAQMESYSNLQKAVKNIIGLSVDISKGQLSVKGRLYRFNDWKKLADWNLHFQMKAELSEVLQQEAQNYFLHLMKQERLPRQNMIFSAPVEIRLNPKSAYKEKYANLFEPYGVQITLDADTLESLPTIKVQITVAEIKRNFGMNYGVQWPDQYQATLMRAGLGPWNDLALTATAMEQQGHGKILASPNIICRSGKEAEFLAGGEFPIKIVNYKIQDIVWKKYGIFMKVKPTADASGHMSVSIETEVSTLDASHNVDGIPGILTNHVSSHFDLLKPQTIALSGLIKNEQSHSRAGLPFLSRLPVLGALFSSRDFQEDRSELVIFVRPTILENEEDPSFSNSPKSHLGDISWN